MTWVTENCQEDPNRAGSRNPRWFFAACLAAGSQAERRPSQRADPDGLSSAARGLGALPLEQPTWGAPPQHRAPALTRTGTTGELPTQGLELENLPPCSQWEKSTDGSTYGLSNPIAPWLSLTGLEAPLPPAAWGPASSRPTRTGRGRSRAQPLPRAPVFLFPNGNPNNSPSPVGEATVWGVLTFRKQGVHRHLGTREKTELSAWIQGCSQRS